MANKVKSSKSKGSGKEGFKKETTEKVEVKHLLKDERTHKITGTIFLLIAFLLFISFTSYLFTWQQDQDKVQHGYKLLLGTDNAKVNNLLGTFGAFISHFFIYKGFGIAAYFISSFFFVVGINLFFAKKVFSVRRNIKYVITGLIIVSVSAAVLMNGKAFPWGGAVGTMVKEWMYRTIGEIGTLAVIAVAILGYIIWRFNPVFALPSRKINNSMEADGMLSEDTSSAEGVFEIQEDVVKTNNKRNAIKGDGGMLNIPLEVNSSANHDLQIIEKEMPVVDEKLNREEVIEKNIFTKEIDLPDNANNKVINKNELISIHCTSIVSYRLSWIADRYHEKLKFWIIINIKMEISRTNDRTS